jgi:diacylglycerol O-acyltransferase / wax synthase
MVWVPQAGDIGLGVSILSFNGKVQFGLLADAALVPDPQAIIDRFEPEFEQLLYFALMQAWPAEPEQAPVATKPRASVPVARSARRKRSAVR